MEMRGFYRTSLPNIRALTFSKGKQQFLPFLEVSSKDLVRIVYDATKTTG